MSSPFRSRRISGIRHFGTISRILIKHGLGEVVDRLFGRSQGKAKSGWPDPARIRRALEDLGPSFIKLGQLMSTRADLFPPEYIEEFSKLQDQVPPVPFEQIRQLRDVHGQKGKRQARPLTSSPFFIKPQVKKTPIIETGLHVYIGMFGFEVKHSVN